MNKNKLNLVVNRQEQMQNDSTLTGPRGAGGLHNISFHPRKSGLKGGGWVIFLDFCMITIVHSLGSKKLQGVGLISKKATSI